METPPTPPLSSPVVRQGPTWKSIILFTLAVFVVGCGVTAAATAWWVKRNIYASPITPVSLTASEQQTLEAKLQVLNTSTAPAAQPEVSPGEQERTLIITAREINAYLANQNLGDTVKVDLGQDNISATVLVPIPPDAGVPLLSGTTLRLGLAINAMMDENKKVALVVRDVRVGGMPLPNAWLGDIKGVNLAGNELEKDPALQRFLAGIQSLEITPTGLRIVLAE
ncbi:hypothetical protein SAMN02745166_04277 [Prosthecobacter debontii]|uniref:Arginine N-succinyltransferase n=1 Tax=Prosthecobacter debontii TaxID=48467 RepID=A0A1T4YUN7_9BACT|nr:hypothetical protein [Prosthecobacter debontii]SKB05460.1 hypothetical protein SAMN02745166_04277 [Prosthecobacter debontii]